MPKGWRPDKRVADLLAAVGFTLRPRHCRPVWRRTVGAVEQVVYVATSAGGGPYCRMQVWRRAWHRDVVLGAVADLASWPVRSGLPLFPLTEACM